MKRSSSGVIAFGVLLCCMPPANAQVTQKPSSAIPLSTATDLANRGAVASIGFNKKPAVLWKYSVDKSSFGGMDVYGGTVVALDRDNGKVIGLSAETGDRMWEYKSGSVFGRGMGLVMTCDPEFDAVVVGSDSGLFALEKRTGKRIWQHLIESGVNGPTIASGLVIAGGADGNVYAIDLKTGDLKWKHDYLEDAPDDPEGFDGDRARFTHYPARPQPASTDGRTVFLSIFDQYRTLAIDVESGKRRWAFQSKGWMGSRPTITNDVVYVASQDRHFYAVDKKTGEEIWNIQTKKWNSASPAITDRFVVFGSNDGHVYAVLREMGSAAWEYDVTNGGKVRSSMYSRPLISGGIVYQPVMNGTLHAIDFESGKMIWTLEPVAESEIDSDPHFDEGRLFLHTRQGRKGDVSTGESAIVAIGIPTTK